MKTKFDLVVIIVCGLLASSSAAAQAHYDWNNGAFFPGYHAGVLHWSTDHCNGSISHAHAQALLPGHVLDPAKFEEAAAMGYRDSVELSMQSALEFHDAGTDAGRLGNNVVCQVAEQMYGPHGALWIGAWIPPKSGVTTAK